MVMVLGTEKHVVENGWSPIGAPLNVQRNDQQQQQHWSNNNSNNFDSSVNAVSFGFVATAVLISMFLLMAIFERFLAPSSQALFPNLRRSRRTSDSPIRKLGHHHSPKMNIFTSWVSVLMPGDEIPTFIAQPAPVPCCPERISWPSHQHTTLSCSTSNVLPSNNNINQV